MYAYCLFCVTQRCRIIAKLLEIRGVDRAFAPQIVRRQRKKGVNREVRYDLLPGYVFIYNEERLTDYRLFFGMDGVIRRVGRTPEGYELSGPDLDFAMKLLEKDGLVGAMKTCKVGDEVKLEDPLFNGCQGRVTRIDYRKERARVDFVFDGLACHTWISLDAVKSQRKAGTEETPLETAMKQEE